MRLLTTTQRVETKYGSHYVAVSRDPTGMIREIAISSPGKFTETEMSRFVLQIQDAINDVIGGMK